MGRNSATHENQTLTEASRRLQEHSSHKRAGPGAGSAGGSKAHSSARHTKAGPCPTQRDSHANDTEKEYEQISEFRLTLSHGSLSQEEAQKRVEENRKDW